KGMGVGAIVKTMVLLPLGMFQSARLLGAFRPQVVIGVGGYASAPVAFAAWLLRIPLIVVEPNSYAGLANRLIGRIADSVVLSFPGTNEQGFFPAAKAVVTGPLVRDGIDKGLREKALTEFGLSHDRFTVLVFGGSGGAHAINSAMKEAAGSLQGVKGLQVLHQTGEKDVEEVKAGYGNAAVAAVVLPYIYDMAGAYAAADLVICRSGATTVAELAVCGKPSVLVPYPFAADNHQEYNARTLAARGTAEVVLQKELTADALARIIRKHAEAGRAQAPRMETQAAAEIVRICKKHVQKD
ncbi:MAG TPA: UDP-N-acetylglucosamine--N-acetylmuramyl-(pentapeptide) pyrophosphoryl-undecaprenol N-acetylglucosamine transferase, partial [Nitrospiraceae bacterium]|nr:UDP-N-acetylglucosamine--N-acetylmuramyl-(pentapeptide) pyrophosphoryl-undecaprenol N-acetylglucosamine transferase [Nitrospiraceae bacterium]